MIPVSCTILVGRRAPQNGAQVFFCLVDHDWIYGKPSVGRGWSTNHGLQVHGRAPVFIEAPPLPDYRPPVMG